MNSGNIQILLTILTTYTKGITPHQQTSKKDSHIMTVTRARSYQIKTVKVYSTIRGRYRLWRKHQSYLCIHYIRGIYT